jgi:(R)-2-hydroxyacyl-CoA dehydratese activating ATPase
MITAGIDAGAATTKAVLLKDNAVIGYVIKPTGFDFYNAAEKAYHEALAAARHSPGEVESICATGYGKNSVRFAHRTLSEITAHARGVGFLFPEAQGIIDIGGQDSKVILIEKGKVIDFLMNDKCAAGTGKFLEYTAKALEVSIEDLGPLALLSKRPASISSMCTVFAESEVISLRAKAFSKEDIAAGLVRSIARRVAVMAKRIGLKRNIVLVGGVAKNAGIHDALEKELGIELRVPFEPQITGALGASLYGGK